MHDARCRKEPRTVAHRARLAVSQPNSPWHNRRVTLMGLGRHGGGIGAARWLASQGARLTITDLAAPDQLAVSLAAIADLPVERYAWASTRQDDFTSAEVVVVNPAVKPDHPLVELARHRGAQITSETELFLQCLSRPRHRRHRLQRQEHHGGR